MERYEKIMVNSCLGDVSKFIKKWGINMVPIDIGIAVNDLETNTTNILPKLPELETKLYRKCV